MPFSIVSSVDCATLLDTKYNISFCLLYNFLFSNTKFSFCESINIFSKLLQSAKEQLEIVFKFSGILICFKLKHLSKHDCFIIVTPSGIFIYSKFSHPVNVYCSREVRYFGKVIFLKFVQK